MYRRKAGLLGWRWLMATALLGVCLAQNLQPPPPSVQEPPENTVARVVSSAGQVSMLKDNVPWALQEGDSVAAGKIIVSGPDGHAIFQVSDGSTFQVFPNSRVVFRSNHNWKDLIDLYIGRVKVYIQKWGGQPNPNRIHTPTAVISVRGTVFDVEVDAEDNTLVAVEEGQVAVRHRLIPHETPRLVSAGEELRVYKNTPLAKSRLDKGSLVRKSANVLADTFYSIMLQGGLGRGGPSGAPTPVPTGGGGGSPPLPGDTGAEPPPPPPPPPGDPGAGAPPPPPND